MGNSNSNKYISLKTAAGLYGYTRDHLGLMIRRGKLNGKKMGSYYVTTGEWVLDYIKNFADPDHPAFRNKLSNKFVSEIFSAKPTIKNNAKKPVEFANYNNELGAKILEELKQREFIAKEKQSAPTVGHVSQNILGGFNSPYAILPIRQMRSDERNKILKESGIDEGAL